MFSLVTSLQITKIGVTNERDENREILLQTGKFSKFRTFVWAPCVSCLLQHLLPWSFRNEAFGMLFKHEQNVTICRDETN